MGGSSSVFIYFLDKVRQQISYWQFSMLNQAAKLLLVNLILVAIASHVMALYFFPKYMFCALKSCLLKFQWGGCQTKRAVYWRSQGVFQLHKSRGGLGFRNFTSLNATILLNQAWQIHKDKSFVMSRVVTGHYGASPLQLFSAIGNRKNMSYGMRSLIHAGRALYSGDGL